ncbi:MAG: polysaccharide deacetylase family protein [Anaerolineae bacterium]|nr:polysaccharide deacetylase family protein [Anaerolineae bacterium]
MQPRVDGIGCAGFLFLVMILLVAAAGVIAPEEEPAVVGEPVALEATAQASTEMGPMVAVAGTGAPATSPPLVVVEAAPVEGATAPPTTAAAAATIPPEPEATAVLVEPAETLAPAIGVTSPLPTPITGLTRTVAAPILMYHYISEPPEDADIYREDLSVTPSAFREQLQYLMANGYTVVDLYDLVLGVSGKTSLPEKPVVITFDDGYLDQYTNAFPVLKEFGVTGTFFIITEFVDSGNPAYMSWPMIEEMAAAGMRIESHSKSHPDLSEAERDEAIWQILGSQETIAAHIGYTPRFFCYPGGRYTEETIEILQELDFWGAVTTAGGVMHSHENRYEWKRIRIRNTTTLPVFAAILNP